MDDSQAGQGRRGMARSNGRRQASVVAATLMGCIAAGLPRATTAVCAFTQKCDQRFDPTCHPINATGMEPVPFSNEGVFLPSPFVCPQYTDSTCCNGMQNAALATNFILINAGFYATGGNMACVQNMYSFWCAFSCSPNQSEFVTVGELANMTDPSTGQEHVVMQSTIYVDRYFACGVWESCKHTFTSELASLRTCEQFFTYQVTQGISRGAFSTFVYVEPSSAIPVGKTPLGISLPRPRDPPAHAIPAMSIPLYDCCSYPVNFSDPTGPNMSAPCAYCGGMCPASGSNDQCYTFPTSGSGGGNASTIDTVTIAVMYGAQWTTVIAMYAAIAGFTIALTVYRAWCAKRVEDSLCGACGRSGGDKGGNSTADSRHVVYSLPAMADRLYQPVTAPEGDDRGQLLRA